MPAGSWEAEAGAFGAPCSVVTVANRDDSRLNPDVDPAHIRAFFIDPGAARTGIGTLILLQSEADAAAQGFSHYDMMATLTGRPFYARHGYLEGSEFSYTLPGGLGFPLVHMEKRRGG
jgi:GNAT superfamily N-acetyltransferase